MVGAVVAETEGAAGTRLVGLAAVDGDRDGEGLAPVSLLTEWLDAALSIPATTRAPMPVSTMRPNHVSEGGNLMNCLSMPKTSRPPFRLLP